jgi:hypothetical protein
MGQFRTFASISFTFFHVIAFITLILMFNMVGMELSGTYFWTSIFATLFSIFITAGLVVTHIKKKRMASKSQFPSMMPFSSSILLYDLAVLSLILIGWSFSPFVYVTLNILVVTLFIFSLIIVGDFSQLVSQRDHKIEAQVNRIKQNQLHVHHLKMQLESYGNQAGGKQLLTKLSSLEEAIRYSDPISHEAVQGTDDSIEEMLLDLRGRVEGLIGQNTIEKDFAQLESTIDSVHQTVKYRNQELRLSK